MNKQELVEIKIKEVIETYGHLIDGKKNLNGGYATATIKDIVFGEKYIEVTADIETGYEEKKEIYKDVYYWLDKKDYHLLKQEEYEKLKEEENKNEKNR